MVSTHCQGNSGHGNVAGPNRFQISTSNKSLNLPFHFEEAYFARPSKRWRPAGNKMAFDSQKEIMQNSSVI